ncbi:MAG: alpha/beta hydrolase [Alphaproteobacteria bacterium]|nr:alpha/beta hydrolase [Alphaproteobacteria bacterium]
MLRYATLSLAALGLAGASPAAAQSLALIYLPTQPVVTWQDQAEPAAAPQREQTTRLALPRAARGQAIAYSAMPRDLPQWRAPVRQPAAQGFAQSRRPAARYGALQYGPFRVIGDRVELVGETDAMSPSWFARVLEDNPGLSRLEMIECPGTLDDRANLQLGRMIRKAGLSTHVPAHGSVRSGAVELFLAGIERSMEPGAEFAVHSWRDEYGREADDFSLDAPENRVYLDYYADMGMSPQQARAFYAMTNSVPHHRARWMEAGEMGRWVDRYAKMRSPRIAYLSVRMQ